MKSSKGPLKKLNLFDKIVLGLNIFCSLCILLSYLAPSTDPRTNWYIALLGFGYQVLLVVNIIFIVYWLIRRRILAIMSAASLLVGFSTFMSYCQFRTKGPIGIKQDSTNIRIMQYNVRKFKGIEEFDGEASQSRILALVNDKKPDILAMEEYSKEKPSRDTVTDNSFKKVMNSSQYYCRLFKSTEKWPATWGNAIYSKYPIVDSGYVDATQFLHVKAIFIDVKFNGKIFRVYCIHLAAVEIDAREKSEYLNGGVSLNNSGFILTKLKLAFLERSYQVDVIKRDLEKCPYPYIIMGDFNDTPNSFSVNQLSDGLKNAFQEKGSGFGITFHSKFPKLQVDHILVTPQFDVLDYEIVDNLISDHYPVVADLKLK